MRDNKRYNKELFVAEAVIGVASTIMLLTMIATAAVLIETGTQVPIAILMIVISMTFFIVVCLGLTKMEQVVGYYVCGKCHHKYVPGYNAVLWSMHLGRTRRMKCPKCHKKTWQKKVL